MFCKTQKFLIKKKNLKNIKTITLKKLFIFSLFFSACDDRGQRHSTHFEQEVLHFYPATVHVCEGAR